MKRDGRTVTKVLIRDIAFSRGENWPGLTFTVVSRTLRTALKTASSLCFFFFFHASFKKRKINLLILFKPISSSSVSYRCCFVCFLESNMFSANMVRQYSFLNQVMTELEADPTQVCFLCSFLLTVTYE